ncbi:uncharacterized protein LOC142587627 [Dermacentor variabilis]|uniref:uncharacterized protein LOC142587627 n=1 Tax=Dermacentor variabilis TaxID=34621 RepID=UPI003F5BE6C5
MRSPSETTAALLLLIVINMKSLTCDAETTEDPSLYDRRAAGSEGQTSPSNTTKAKGKACMSSEECQENLCCLRQQSTNTCQPLAKLLQKCSVEQVRGAIYSEHCPCKPGQVCRNSIIMTIIRNITEQPASTSGRLCRLFGQEG